MHTYMYMYVFTCMYAYIIIHVHVHVHACTYVNDCIMWIYCQWLTNHPVTSLNVHVIFDTSPKEKLCTKNSRQYS